MALYFSLGFVQPFAEMETAELRDHPGVEVVRGDGKVVGLRLAEPQLVLRLPEVIAELGLDAERVWARLRADDDPLINRRQVTWGGGGA
jgi:hypothetical protein